MTRNDNIEFLNQLRGKIDRYLILGYAPSERAAIPAAMRKALATEEFQRLRREINEMKSRAHDLLDSFGIRTVVREFPGSAIGGPIQTFKLFDLVIQNGTS